MSAPKPKFFAGGVHIAASVGFALFWALASVAYAPPVARPPLVESGKKPGTSKIGPGKGVESKPLSKVLRDSVARGISELESKSKASEASPKQRTTIRSKWIEDGASRADLKLGLSTTGKLTEEQAAIRFSHWSRAVHGVREDRYGVIVQYGVNELFVRSEEFNEVFDAFWGSEETNWAELGTGSVGKDDTEPLKRLHNAALDVFQNNRFDWSDVQVRKFVPEPNKIGFPDAFSDQAVVQKLLENDRNPSTRSHVCLVVDRPEDVRRARTGLGDGWWKWTQVVWNKSGKPENVKEQMARVPSRITVLHGMPRNVKEGQDMHGEAFRDTDLPDVEQCRADAARFVTPDADDVTLKSHRQMRQRNVDLALEEMEGAKTMAEKAMAVIQRATEEDLVIQLGCVSGTDMVFADGSRLPLDPGNIKCQLFLLGCQTAIKADVAADQARIGTLRNVTYREARTVVRSFGVTRHAAFSIMEHLMQLESNRRLSLTPKGRARHVNFGPKSPFIMIANAHTIEIQTQTSSATAFAPSRVLEAEMFAFHTSIQP